MPYKLKLILRSLIFAIVILGMSATHAASWTIIDLGSDFTAYGMNNAGQVAGSVYLPNPSTGLSEIHAALYIQGQLVVDSRIGFALGINNLGQAYGSRKSTEDPNSPMVGFIYSGGSINAAPTGFKSVEKMNDTGGIAGRYQDATTKNPDGIPAAYLNGKFYFLPVVESTITGLNNAGQMVGKQYAENHAYLYDSNGLLTMPGYSSASGINNAGLAVGTFTVTGGKEHAFSYYKGATTDLTPDVERSAADGINNVGHVIGRFNPIYGSPEFFLYKSKVFTDLTFAANLTAQGWKLFSLTAINDADQILATAYNYGDSKVHAIILTPPSGR